MNLQLNLLSVIGFISLMKKRKIQYCLQFQSSELFKFYSNNITNGFPTAHFNQNKLHYHEILNWSQLIGYFWFQINQMNSKIRCRWSATDVFHLSFSQIKVVNTNIKLAANFLQRCPSCLKNFVQNLCDFTCSPKQSTFMRAQEYVKENNSK